MRTALLYALYLLFCANASAASQQMILFVQNKKACHSTDHLLCMTVDEFEKVTIKKNSYGQRILVSPSGDTITEEYESSLSDITTNSILHASIAHTNPKPGELRAPDLQSLIRYAQSNNLLIIDQPNYPARTFACRIFESINNSFSYFCPKENWPTCRQKQREQLDTSFLKIDFFAQATSSSANNIRCKGNNIYQHLRDALVKHNDSLLKYGYQPGLGKELLEYALLKAKERIVTAPTPAESLTPAVSSGQPLIAYQSLVGFEYTVQYQPHCSLQTVRSNIRDSLNRFINYGNATLQDLYNDTASCQMQIDMRALKAQTDWRKTLIDYYTSPTAIEEFITTFKLSSHSKSREVPAKPARSPKYERSPK